MSKKVHHVFQVVELGVDKKLFFFFFQISKKNMLPQVSCIQ